MTFAPGDPVHVAALGRGVVLDVRNAGRYLVDVKGRSFIVDGDQLTPADGARPSRRVRRSTPPVGDSAPADHRDRIVRSLDLHGKTVLEAMDTLDEFVNDALVADAAEVRIIHGRSGGRLKAAVHARLKQMSSVRGFRVDPLNAGMTIVKL